MWVTNQASQDRKSKMPYSRYGNQDFDFKANSFLLSAAE
jgi:hypothetical protein